MAKRRHVMTARRKAALRKAQLASARARKSKGAKAVASATRHARRQVSNPAVQLTVRGRKVTLAGGRLGPDDGYAGVSATVLSRRGSYYVGASAGRRVRQ
jgi:hypothetical protein